MRNRNADGSLSIPDHFKPEFNEITEELRLASEERDAASARHLKAVLARIATSDGTGEEELFFANEQLADATKRFYNAIAARIELADKINEHTRELEQHRWAS